MLLGKRKGVGEIFAAMVLILIASILGSLLFNYSLRSSNEQTVLAMEEINDKEAIAREKVLVTFLKTQNNLGEFNITIWLMNYGDIDVSISSIYVNNIKFDEFNIDAPFSEDSAYKNSYNIYTQDIKKFNIPNSSIVYENDVEFNIIVVSQRGVVNESIWIYKE
jgi:hypothetical protein